MDNNNMFQDMPLDGPDPGTNQNSNYGGSTYQDSQNTNYDANTYQDSQNTNYGANTYQDSQNTNYGGNAYPDNNVYNQNTYTNPGYQPYNNSGYQTPQMDLEEPVKVGEWLITILIMMIPCVNIIMMFVWAFSSSEKKSKSNYFKAVLIYTGIVLAIYLIAVIFIVVAGVGIGASYF